MSLIVSTVQHSFVRCSKKKEKKEKELGTTKKSGALNAVQKVSLTQSEKVKQLVYPSKTESFLASQGNMKKKKL